MLGRLDHMVKVAGVRVQLEEVESCLASHPSVARAAARVWYRPVLDSWKQQVQEGGGLEGIAGAGGSRGNPSSGEGSARVSLTSLTSSTASGEQLAQGEAVLVSYVLRDVEASKQQSLGGELRAWVAERLVAAALPSEVVVVRQLPTNPAGKVLRQQLPPPHWLQGAQQRQQQQRQHERQEQRQQERQEHQYQHQRQQGQQEQRQEQRDQEQQEQRMVGGRGSGFATGRSNGEGSEGSARQGATFSERLMAWVQGVYVPLVPHRRFSQTGQDCYRIS